MSEMQEIAVPLLGYASVVCWCLIFCPQLIQNYRQRGAPGLSLSMFLLWAWAGFASAAFVLYQGGDISLVIQWMVMAVTSIGVVFQIYGYEVFSASASPRLRWFKACIATCFWAACSTAWLVGTLYLFRAEIDPALPLFLGVVLPSVLLAIGFLPQIYEFHKLHSGSAYSSMLACFDISGCIFGMAAWILQGGASDGLVAYIVILVLQIFMLLLKHAWYAASAKGPAGATLGPPDAEDRSRAGNRVTDGIKADLLPV
jgi:uncharacterized protein with PQ loop repeat